jgi:hypothetical protein
MTDPDACLAIFPPEMENSLPLMVVVNFFSITSPVIKKAASCKEIFQK